MKVTKILQCSISYKEMLRMGHEASLNCHKSDVLFL